MSGTVGGWVGGWVGGTVVLGDIPQLSLPPTQANQSVDVQM